MKHAAKMTFSFIVLLVLINGCAMSPMSIHWLSKEELRSVPKKPFIRAVEFYPTDVNLLDEAHRRGLITAENLIYAKRGCLNVGMSYTALGGAWGIPYNMNVSVGSYGVKIQWCFRDFNSLTSSYSRKYAYTRNGKVTSWQF